LHTRLKSEKTEVNKRLGTHKHRREDNIKTDHDEMCQGYGQDSVSGSDEQLCGMHPVVCHVRNRLCGVVIRVPGYRSRGPGFDSRLCQIF
jgi:hypothetical protein